MARDIWLISDTHWGHENILKFKDGEGNLIRGAQFSTVEEMDEFMVDRWNSTVKKGDIVYHLGDVFMGSKERFESNFKKLNGAKRLIVGNHDDIKYLARTEFFQKVLMWRMFPEYNVILSHVPLHESSILNFRKIDEEGNPTKYINIHGHIHQNLSPSEDYRCVCVEHTNYGPVSIEEAKNLNNYIK